MIEGQHTTQYPLVIASYAGLVEAEAAFPKAAGSPEQLATRFVAAIGELLAIEAQAKDLNAEQHEQQRQHSYPSWLKRLQTVERVNQLSLFYLNQSLKVAIKKGRCLRPFFAKTSIAAQWLTGSLPAWRILL